MNTAGPGFYGSYQDFKDYRRPSLGRKQIARFDAECWTPMAMAPGQAVLEIGCGTGLFLAYLKAKGVSELIGIDVDGAVADHLPEGTRPYFRAGDVRAFLDAGAEGKTFDRAFLLDVLEHFSAEDGAALLASIGKVLRPGGRILVRLPNMGSPWGANYQYGDLTHRSGYNPTSLRQLAIASGFVCTACLPHEQGSPSRRFLDRAFHGLVGRLIMTPPEIWTANFYGVLEKK
jgi:SAM-dependent methyltransferase